MMAHLIIVHRYVIYGGKEIHAYMSFIKRMAEEVWQEIRP